MSASLKGRTRTNIQRENISKAKKGKPLSKEHKDKLKGRKVSDEVKEKLRTHATGRKHSPETKTKLSELAKGHVVSEEQKRKIGEANRKRLGAQTSNWKGGVTKSGIILYDSYSQKLAPVEETRRHPINPEILLVKCAYCGRWFQPTYNAIIHRVSVLQGKSTSPGLDSRLYCNNSCKKQCPIYKQVKYPKDYEPIDAKFSTSREVQTELRKMVFERDNYTCQECGSTINLHCHHWEGVEINPIESADIDICSTLCEGCHKWVHTLPGCTRNELKRKPCITN